MYIYIYVKILSKLNELKKTQKNRGYIDSLPSVGGRQRALPSASRQQSCHVAATGATWQLGAALFGRFAVSQQTTKAFASLTSAGSQQSTPLTT